MKKGLLIGVVLGVVLSLGLLSLGQRVMAQGASRLQWHSQYVDKDFGARSFVAVCDTGNGAMIYASNNGITSVANGCK